MKECSLVEKTIRTDWGNTISIYLLPEEQLDALTEEDRSALHPYYLAKMEARKHPDAKRHALASGYLLRKVLGVTPDQEILVSEKGKPSVPGSSKQFSLSHDDDITVLAVADEPVGVDVEKRTPYDPRIAEKVFPEVYRDYIEAAANGAGTKEHAADAVSAAFTECWTKLEAVLKADGSGLRRMRQDSEALLLQWSVQSFPYESYWVSVAYKKV